jgi:peptide/nickel transport system permease protein
MIDKKHYKTGFPKSDEGLTLMGGVEGDVNGVGIEGPTSSKPRSYRSIFWKQFKKDKFAVAALYVIGLLCVVALLSPYIATNKPYIYRTGGKAYYPAFVDYPQFLRKDWDYLRDHPESEDAQAIFAPVPYDPLSQSLTERLSAPSSRHWFGTDNLGRDVLSRMIHGTGLSLRIGFIAVGIATFIGLILGSIAGFYGGWVDILVSRLIEVFMCFPFFFLILIVIAFLPPRIENIMIAIGVATWPGIARYVRAEFLKNKEEDFVAAARALGYSDARIIFRHVLPNSLTPVLVSISFRVAGAILSEAALSFLGFGVQPPTPSWGNILSLAKVYIETAWWLALFPGIAIFITVTAYNLIGEGVRDAADPKLMRA